MIDWTGPVFFLLLFNCLLVPRHLRVAPVTPPRPPSHLTSGGAGYSWGLGPVRAGCCKKGWKTLGLDDPDPLGLVFPDLLYRGRNLEGGNRSREFTRGVSLSKRVSVTD